MRVRELLELIPALEQADPEDVVIINADAKSILLLNTCPGLHQTIDQVADVILTEWDTRFLRSLGMRFDNCSSRDPSF